MTVGVKRWSKFGKDIQENMDIVKNMLNGDNMYKIKRCKICKQRLHIRQKGRYVEIRNACIHFPDKLLTKIEFVDMVIPLKQYAEPIKTIKDRHLCVLHNTVMEFKKHLRRFNDLYYCRECASVDVLIPTKYIKKWIKWTKNFAWKFGDVKVISSPDYNTIKKWR